MWNMDTRSERSDLGFAEAVRSAFEFLQTEYGFRLAQVQPTFVRYESARVFVNLYHGRASYELGFEIGQRVQMPNETERPFYLGEIIELAGAEEAAAYTFLQASTIERVQRLIPRLAELVKEYSRSALAGDPDTFQELAELRAREAQHQIKEANLSRVREEAEEAWRNKHYRLVVELYNTIGDDLTRIEAARLAYARKQS